MLFLAPRKWIHAPKAELRFAEKRTALRKAVDALNDELRRRGVEEVDEFGRTKTERIRQRRIEKLRTECRMPFLADIEALTRKTLPDALRQLECERREKDAEAIGALLWRHGGRLPSFAKVAHKDAWVVNASIAHWQLAVVERFILGAKEGTHVRTGEVSGWINETFGIDAQVGRLIDAQRIDRERRKRRGDSSMDLGRHAWFFDEAENRLIPNIFQAVNALMVELVDSKLLLMGKRWTYIVDGPLGKERRRLAEVQRVNAIAEERQRQDQQDKERRSSDRKAFLEQQKRRIEYLTQIYGTLAEVVDQCLDCQDCRWPRAPEIVRCPNCGSTNGMLIRLDAQRLEEVPHRLRSDPRVMTSSSYIFE